MAFKHFGFSAKPSIQEKVDELKKVYDVGFSDLMVMLINKEFEKVTKEIKK